MMDEWRTAACARAPPSCARVCAVQYTCVQCGTVQAAPAGEGLSV